MMKKSHSRIGEDPLDTVISPPMTPMKEKPKEPSKRKRFAIYLPPGLAEKARDVVYWTPGVTLSDLVEEALAREIERRVEKRGEPFPPRSGEIPKGRPVK